MEAKLTYEEAIKKLEDIIGELEKGDLSLDKSIDLYAQGIHFVKVCKDHLEKAEGKIKILVEDEEIDFNLWSREE
ncbi:MAG: exodeoxyribonuclease VII small subunit [Clostridia bacterium]|jgi:exodeoxyribonuclease VII small subunit|nr:exodeoxyribonuclease VII small subunit [Clostridia bacterium]